MSENELNNPNQGVTSELIGMSAEDALKYLELPSDANESQIDDAFWKLTKNARSIKDDALREQRLADLSYAFDVATGKEARRIKAMEERAATKKYFGKTKEEWGVYFGYTWYRYLIVIVGIIIVLSIGYRMFFTPKEDISILSIGHFDADVEVMENRLKDSGFVNPFVNTANTVVPNDEGESNSSIADMTSSVLFASSPEIIITDEKSCKYFFEQFQDLSVFYESLRNSLSSEVFEKIEPIYCSEYEKGLISVEYLESMKMEADRSELDEMSQEQIIIGLKVTDTTFIKKLGYTNLWPKTEPTLVIGIGHSAKDNAKCEKVISDMLMELNQ